MDENIYILVVDDNQENLKVVGNFLKEIGYKIALALNGKSALKILETNPIDLILLDVMMPEMDGFETCKLIKENPLTQDIPIIFLSAKTETDDVLRCFDVGGSDYILKPFKKEELFARVSNYIKIKRISQIINQQLISGSYSEEQYNALLQNLKKIFNL